MGEDADNAEVETKNMTGDDELASTPQRAGTTEATPLESQDQIEPIQAEPIQAEAAPVEPSTSEALVPPTHLAPPAVLAPPTHLAPPGVGHGQALPPADRVPRPAGLGNDPPPPASGPGTGSSSSSAYPVASIEEIVPVTGPVVGQTKLTIVGKGIARATIARVGGQLARTLSVHPENRIVVLTPAVADDGPVEVSLQNPGHEPSVAAERFCYLPVPAPHLDAVAPKNVPAAGGAGLSLIGRDFLANCQVTINGRPATRVVFVDAETVEVEVPEGRAGSYGDVAIENPDGQLSLCRRAFMYN